MSYIFIDKMMATSGQYSEHTEADAAKNVHDVMLALNGRSGVGAPSLISTYVKDGKQQINILQLSTVAQFQSLTSFVVTCVVHKIKRLPLPDDIKKQKGHFHNDIIKQCEQVGIPQIMYLHGCRSLMTNDAYLLISELIKKFPNVATCEGIVNENNDKQATTHRNQRNLIMLNFYKFFAPTAHVVDWFRVNASHYSAQVEAHLERKKLQYSELVYGQDFDADNRSFITLLSPEFLASYNNNVVLTETEYKAQEQRIQEAMNFIYRRTKEAIVDSDATHSIHRNIDANQTQRKELKQQSSTKKTVLSRTNLGTLLQSARLLGNRPIRVAMTIPTSTIKTDIHPASVIISETFSEVDASYAGDARFRLGTALEFICKLMKEYSKVTLEYLNNIPQPSSEELECAQYLKAFYGYEEIMDFIKDDTNGLINATTTNTKKSKSKPPTIGNLTTLFIELNQFALISLTPAPGKGNKSYISAIGEEGMVPLLVGFLKKCKCLKAGNTILDQWCILRMYFPGFTQYLSGAAQALNKGIVISLHPHLKLISEPNTKPKTSTSRKFHHKVDSTFGASSTMQLFSMNNRY